MRGIGAERKIKRHSTEDIVPWRRGTVREENSNSNEQSAKYVLEVRRRCGSYSHKERPEAGPFDVLKFYSDPLNGQDGLENWYIFYLMALPTTQRVIVKLCQSWIIFKSYKVYPCTPDASEVLVVKWKIPLDVTHMSAAPLAHTSQPHTCLLYLGV